MFHLQNRVIIKGALATGAVLLAIVFCVPAGLRSFFYPKPGKLPPIVTPSTADLLVQLQAVLEKRAPEIAKSLQPGLTDAQITALETQNNLHIPNELRDLYRWHNGMNTNSPHWLLPGQSFPPLEESIHNRITPNSIASFIFAGHQKSWINVLDDRAGDGYFFDPERTEKDGPFFYHFAETGTYRWFPSLKNFISGLIDCYETQAIQTTTNSIDMKENSEQTEKIWNRLSVSNENR